MAYAAPIANDAKEHPDVATPNYSYEKRQRELAKKRKLEEKKQRKVQQRQGGEHEPGAQDAGAPAAPHADAGSPPPAAD